MTTSHILSGSGLVPHTPPFLGTTNVYTKKASIDEKSYIVYDEGEVGRDQSIFEIYRTLISNNGPC